MTARSTVLAVVTINDTAAHDVVTCPANTTLLLKQINYNNIGGTATSLTIMLRRAGQPYWLVNTSSLATNSPQIWSGWVVLQPGDIVRIVCGASTMTFWLSGTHLDSVAPS